MKIRTEATTKTTVYLNACISTELVTYYATFVNCSVRINTIEIVLIQNERESYDQQLNQQICHSSRSNSVLGEILRYWKSVHMRVKFSQEPNGPHKFTRTYPAFNTIQQMRILLLHLYMRCSTMAGYNSSLSSHFSRLFPIIHLHT